MTSITQQVTGSVSLIFCLALLGSAHRVQAQENLSSIVALQQGQISTITERMDRTWKPCGTLKDLAGTCSLSNYPLNEYEYGINFNSEEPMSVVCVKWNKGFKIHNRQPFITYTDDPSAAKVMKWGGFMFYTGTNAADDETCSPGAWRHRYWSITSDQTVSAPSGNGCYDKQVIFCRRH